jgi:transposase
VVRKKLDRSKMLEYFIKLQPCLIGMEACGSAHYWARKLVAMGHTVKLMAPQCVKLYVKSNKNDAADAGVICEAVTRPNIWFVPIKTALSKKAGSVALADKKRVWAQSRVYPLTLDGFVLPAHKIDRQKTFSRSRASRPGLCKSCA